LGTGVVVSEVAHRHDLRPQQLFAYPERDEAVALVLPAVLNEAMGLFLTDLAGPPSCVPRLCRDAPQQSSFGKGYLQVDNR
jgi:hypothetical protein